MIDVGRGDLTPPCKWAVTAKRQGGVKTVPCRLPVRLHCRCSCNGRHICRPYGLPVIFVITYGRGRGLPRPYGAVNFVCCGNRKTARRGQDLSLTPPCKWAATAKQQGGVLTVPCRLPVRLHCRDGCNGRHICRPYKLTRYIHYTIRSRAGLAPPLRSGEFCVLRQPQNGKEGS